jgi:hypothetical protein
MTDAYENSPAPEPLEPAAAQPDAPAEPPAAGANGLAVEQAIFTSVPSPMGRGYRLVASSPGLTGDEKREITQRSPSHGNLIDATENGTGLSSFALRGGRWCVLCTWNAEAEHSGRGGLRVHTQAVVLEREVYDRFGCNPLAVAATVASVVDPSLIPKADSKLPLLELPAQPPEDQSAGLPGTAVAPEAIDSIISIVALLVGERKLVVTGNADDATALNLIIELLPPALRRSVSVTCGLRFAPTRQAELVFTEARREELDRIARDHGYYCFAWGHPPEIELSEELTMWFGYARKIWRIEGLSSLRRAYASMGPDANARVLRQIGRLMIDIDRVPQTAPERIDQLLEPHLPFERQNDLQTALHMKLVQVADARRRVRQSLLPDVAITLP